MMSDEMLTQEEFLAAARSEGMDIKYRTLRSWASKGLFPRPTRIPGRGMQGFYPASLLLDLRRVCALRKRSIEEIKMILTREPSAHTMQFIDDAGRPHEYMVLFTLSRSQKGGRIEETRLLEDGSLVVVTTKDAAA